MTRKVLLALASACAVVALLSVCAWGQVSSSQRTFPQSKADVEKALKTLQPGMSGRLPSLEGFAQSDGPSLDRYQRGFYQITADLSPSASGSTLVRLSAK